jgi:hypothetical protein
MTGAASLHFDRSCPEMLVRAWLARALKNIPAGSHWQSPREISFSIHQRWIEVMPSIKKPFEKPPQAQPNGLVQAAAEW